MRNGSSRESAVTTSARLQIQEDQKSPFPREVVLAYLDTSIRELTQLLEQRRLIEDELTEALSRATALLAEIRADYGTAALPSARKLEDSLTGIERSLSDALRIVLADEVEMIREEIALQLKPYRRQMEKEAYDRTLDNLLLKRLRERIGLPRLSLFHL